MVTHLSHSYPVQVVCRGVGYSRSSYYYRPQANQAEARLKLTITKIACRYPTYGDRRITAQLQREGYRATTTESAA